MHSGKRLPSTMFFKFYCFFSVSRYTLHGLHLSDDSKSTTALRLLGLLDALVESMSDFKSVRMVPNTLP